MKKISLPNLAKCYHFVIILLSSSRLMNHEYICMTPFDVRRATTENIYCWNLANVIILLSLLLITFYKRIALGGVRFKGFFWRPKMLFFHPLFCVTIMLSFFYINTWNNILLFFDSICTRVEKILRKWTRIDVQKWDRRNTFGKIRRALGNLRNFFRTHLPTRHML